MNLAKIRAFMTQKAGPLPVWAWAAIILIGILAFWWYKKSGPFAPAGTGAAKDTSLSDTMGSSGGGIGAGPLPPTPAEINIRPVWGQTYDPAAAPSSVPAASAYSPAFTPVNIPTYAAVTPAVAASVPGFQNYVNPPTLLEQASVISQAGQYIGGNTSAGVPGQGSLPKTAPVPS